MNINAAVTGLSRSPQASAKNRVLPLLATVIGLTVIAHPSQSANLTEWQDSGGAAVATLDKTGRLTAANLTLTGFSGVLKASAGVVAGSATTSDLPEGSNLYYTAERVDDRVAALLTAGAGISLTYDDPGNTLTITCTVSAYTDEQAQDAAASLIQNGTGISWVYNDAGNTLTPTVSLSAFSTSDLSEGSRLYYTDARARAAVSGTSNRISYNSTTGVIDIDSAYVGQTSITTLGTIGTGTWQGTSIATGFTDAKVKTVTGTSNRLTIGGTATDPTFDISTAYVGQATITTLGTVATGTWSATAVAETKGGTNQTSYTLGDLLYASAANTLSKLAGNTTTTLNVLAQTGNGSVSAAPAWNATTGTGNVVMSASPTLSGTVGGALTFSGAIAMSSTLTMTDNIIVPDVKGVRTVISGGTRTMILRSGTTLFIGDSDGWTGMTAQVTSGSFLWQVGSTPATKLTLTTSALTVASGVPVTTSDTTDSTTTTTGALIVSGGIGVAKRITLDGGSGKTLRITNAVANGAVAVTFGSVGPTGSTAGNAQGWMRIDIAGTDRFIPFW